MSITFATSALPLADRLDAWSHAVSSVCGPYSTNFGARDEFSAEIIGREIDDLHCARITQNSIVSWRSRREVERVNDQVYYLILQMRGGSRMAQNGRESVLLPGDMTLIDWGVLGPSPMRRAMFNCPCIFPARRSIVFGPDARQGSRSASAADWRKPPGP